MQLISGTTVLLDTSTPVLKFLLINGGHLIFDGEQAELELNSEYILVMNGGSLTIGTEDEKYPSKANITLHGHTRCTEIPVYGCKVINLLLIIIPLPGTEWYTTPLQN